MSASNPKPQASEEPPGVPAEEHVPGAGRRNWVYREMASLGGEPLLDEVLLYLDDPDESQSRASEESAASPTRKQSSSR